MIMGPDSAGAVLEALCKGVVTAFVVAALLLVARRRGQMAAGLLAGLPTVTGPALLWLAVEHGHVFARGAAQGALAAGIPCALFALGYGLGCRRHGPWVSLALGSAAGALPLPWLLGAADAPLHVMAWLLVVAAVAVACQHALAALARTASQFAPVTPASLGCGWWLTAAVSGVVSAVAAGLAGAVGSFGAGLLSSPPLLAAAVALVLHRRPGHGLPALQFLQGYAAGLLGRGLFVAVFGALLQPTGAAGAFVIALLLAAVAGRLSQIRMMRGAASVVSMSAGSGGVPQPPQRAERRP